MQAVHRDDLPVLLEDGTPEPRSWGIRMTNTEVADLAVDFYAALPMPGSRLTVGLALTDAAGNPGVMVAITFVASPDRVVVIAPDGLDAGPGISLQWATAETDDTCSGACVVADWDDAAPGDRHVIGWIAGAALGTMKVRGSAGTTAASTVGAAYALGDADLEGGAPNIQVQPGVPPGNNLGAKAIRDAAFPVTAEHRLYGIWTAIDLKIACVGTCVITANAWEELHRASACGPAMISWTGPGGAGGDGQLFYPIRGPPAGDYAFTVELSADAYMANRLPGTPTSGSGSTSTS